MLVRPLLRPRLIRPSLYLQRTRMATATGSAPNLHLDEVTGEMVSKSSVAFPAATKALNLTASAYSELKKRKATREREEKKKAAAAAQPKPAAATKAPKEDEIPPHVGLKMSEMAVCDAFSASCTTKIDLKRFANCARREIRIHSRTSSMLRPPLVTMWTSMAKRESSRPARSWTRPSVSLAGSETCVHLARTCSSTT